MTDNQKRLPSGYGILLAEVKERIRSAQYEALKKVNRELVTLYWDIGRMIHARQQGSTWGKSIVQQLAGDLQNEFPGVSGFSAQNLWYMRQFYVEYHGNEKLQPLVGEIAWTHNVLIMSRCKDPLEREFYVKMTRKFGWSKNVLAHQIDNQSYQKTMLGQTNFDKALSPELRQQAKLAVRDEYTFDFLELGDQHSERQLERALITQVEDFLRAMGGVFAFIGSQFREDGENPSIGIILCKEKERTIVECALHGFQQTDRRGYVPSGQEAAGGIQGVPARTGGNCQTLREYAVKAMPQNNFEELGV